MVKISTKPRYGLRILAQIAADGGRSSPISGKEVARRQNLSMAYMEQILIPMRNAGLIRTVRGRNGGYLLERDAEDISLLEIIELFEGPLELVESDEANSANALWDRLSAVLRREARSITVAELAHRISADKPFNFNYMI